MPPKGIFKTLFIKRMNNNGFMDSESADDSAFLEIKYLGFTFRMVLLEKNVMLDLEIAHKKGLRKD